MMMTRLAITMEGRKQEYDGCLGSFIPHLLSFLVKTLAPSISSQNRSEAPSLKILRRALPMS